MEALDSYSPLQIHNGMRPRAGCNRNGSKGLHLIRDTVRSGLPNDLNEHLIFAPGLACRLSKFSRLLSCKQTAGVVYPTYTEERRVQNAVCTQCVVLGRKGPKMLSNFPVSAIFVPSLTSMPYTTLHDCDTIVSSRDKNKNKPTGTASEQAVPRMQQRSTNPASFFCSSWKRSLVVCADRSVSRAGSGP